MTSDKSNKPRKVTLNPIIFQKIKRENVFHFSTEHRSSSKRLEIVEEEKHEDDETVHRNTVPREDGLILFNMVANILPYTRYPSSKL